MTTINYNGGFDNIDGTQKANQGMVSVTVFLLSRKSKQVKQAWKTKVIWKVCYSNHYVEHSNWDASGKSSPDEEQTRGRTEERGKATQRSKIKLHGQSPGSLGTCQKSQKKGMNVGLKRNTNQISFSLSSFMIFTQNDLKQRAIDKFTSSRPLCEPLCFTLSKHKSKRCGAEFKES